MPGSMLHHRRCNPDLIIVALPYNPAALLPQVMTFDMTVQLMLSSGWASVMLQFEFVRHCIGGLMLNDLVRMQYPVLCLPAAADRKLRECRLAK